MRPALGTTLLLLAGCASTPKQAPPPRSPPGAPEVRAVRVLDSPIVDGSGSEAAWADAPETSIPLGGPAGLTVRLKAAVGRGTLFLLVRWQDSTESRSFPLPIHKGPESAWRDFDVGDLVTLTMPIDGPFPEDIDAPVECTMDFWRWDSARSDKTGHALDAVLARSIEPGDENPWGRKRLPDGRLLREERRDDGGPPGGSRNNVLARGQWSGGEWTVEFARALSPGFDDDRDLEGLSEIPFRLSVSDKAGAGPESATAHGTTPVLRLLLPPEPEEDKQGPLPDPLGTSRPGR